MGAIVTRSILLPEALCLIQEFIRGVKDSMFLAQVSRPYKQATFEIIYGERVSKLGCILGGAEMMDVVLKKGSCYCYVDQRLGPLGQGRCEALQHLKEHNFAQIHSLPFCLMPLIRVYPIHYMQGVI